MQVQAVCNSIGEFPLCAYSSNSTDGSTWNPKDWWVGDPWWVDNYYTVPPNITITTPTIILEPMINPPITIDVDKVIIEPRIEEKKEKKFRRLIRPIKE